LHSWSVPPDVFLKSGRHHCFVSGKLFGKGLSFTKRGKIQPRRDPEQKGFFDFDRRLEVYADDGVPVS
jgi:hypothetical protein